MYYDIKIENVDFKLENKETTTKGSREKRIVLDNEGKEAFLKYESYDVSESCSEKLAYEIANTLGYKCAKIEFARDINGKLGILNYFFTSDTIIHIDSLEYINRSSSERNKFYTITNIKNTLDEIDKSLFPSFIGMMVFDALIGEQDRHEENWGISIDSTNKYSFSPFYDNGCSLLREFKDEKYASNYYDKKKNFEAFIRRSKTYFYDEQNKTCFKHFDLIKYLYNNYSEYVIKEIKKLNNLSDELIEELVNKVPVELMGDKQKKFIVKYLIIRRNILLDIIRRGD